MIVTGKPERPWKIPLNRQPPNDRIHDGRCIGSKLAAFPERQVVVRREDEVVARVEERRPVVRFRIVCVGPVGSLGVDSAGTVVPEVIRARPAQRVRGEVLDALHVALSEAHLQTVVVAPAARRGRRDVRDQRCGGVERTAGVESCPGRRIARHRAVAGCLQPASPNVWPCARRIRRSLTSEFVTRRSTNTFHCWVNWGRRLGSHARTCPDGLS